MISPSTSEIADELGLIKSTPSGDVIILGAGFSKAVSSRFPLTDELGVQATALAGVQPPMPLTGGRFEAWLSQIAENQPYLSQAENTSNLGLFHRLVQSIHTVICETESEVVADGLPAWLLRFVATLHARQTTVMTFNYDCIIERALRALDLQSFDQPPQPEPVMWTDALGGVPSFPPIPPRWWRPVLPTLRLLKLHGSVNWYAVPGDASGASIHHWNLDDDEDIRTQYLPGREPFLVPPATAKSTFLRNPIMAETWRRAAVALRETRRLTLIGYSLPLADLVAGGLISTTVGRSGVEISVVNPDAGPVVESLLRLTGNSAVTSESVADFADSYVESASRALATQLIHRQGTSSPEALMVVGWRGDLVARVVEVTRTDRRVTLVVDCHDGVNAFAPVLEGSERTAALPIGELVSQLRAGDLIEAIFPGGERSLLIGVDRRRTSTGASTSWQIFLPADRPQVVTHPGPT